MNVYVGVRVCVSARCMSSDVVSHWPGTYQGGSGDLPPRLKGLPASSSPALKVRATLPLAFQMWVLEIDADTLPTDISPA